MGGDRMGAEQTFHAGPVLRGQAAHSVGGQMPAPGGGGQRSGVTDEARQPLPTQPAQGVVGRTPRTCSSRQPTPGGPGRAWPPGPRSASLSHSGALIHSRHRIRRVSGAPRGADAAAFSFPERLPLRCRWGTALQSQGPDVQVPRRFQPPPACPGTPAPAAGPRRPGRRWSPPGWRTPPFRP